MKRFLGYPVTNLSEKAAIGDQNSPLVAFASRLSSSVVTRNLTYPLAGAADGR
jgi:hypothetical protein